MANSIKTSFPGGPQMPPEVVQRLQSALAKKDSRYKPRTRHQQDGVPLYTNRLILETSPYLLQHAHNPVNWFAWSSEAFQVAAAEHKPVFLSVGYSTCHWCHVMEEESFEDEEIAAYLNQNYICVKVDREERPDVDAVYMSAVQNLTGGGGWPMSVWLTPQREPFFGGTYFPPRDGVRGTRRGFLSVLRQLFETFVSQPDEVAKAAQSLVAAVKLDMEGTERGTSSGVPALKSIDDTVAFYKRAFDPVHGGLRRAPKFPSHIPIRLLLRYHKRATDPQALHMAVHTLEKMAAGGMYDQIGGGFHRYSTDAQWLVPHFEKMLYDNALLVLAYAEGFVATGRPDFARVVAEVLDYVAREMTSPEGGFYSATDADSEGEEGSFFVWSRPEIEAILGDEAAEFCAHYGITEKGNFEARNIPFVQRPNEGQWARFSAARAKLYEARSKRVSPARDEKILAAWNGLMISAMAVGGHALNESKYIAMAVRAAAFVLDKLRQGDRMIRSYKDGYAQNVGFLEDQAFVTAGLLDVFEATSDPQWLQQALNLAEATQTHFGDDAQGGWFTVSHDGEALLARERPLQDGAEPSGTSVAIMNALRLATFTDDPRWQKTAERGLASLRKVIETSSMSATEALLALERYWDKPKQIAVVWPAGGRASADALQNVVRTTFVPHRALVMGDVESLRKLSPWVPFVADKSCDGDQPRAYVCEEGRCALPTGDGEVLRLQLAGKALATTG